MATLRLIGLGVVLLVAAGALTACGDDETGEGGTAGAACGPATCTAAQYCCDAACGLCVEAGVACTDSCP